MNQGLVRDARFEVTAHVLHDTIDGEVIAIDLTTGTYYSLRGSAAEVWGLIHKSPGISQNELEHGLLGRYQANGVEVGLSEFLEQLREEGLITPVEGDGISRDVSTANETRNQSSEEFVAPTLEKYTDMQDLVLIDPVHDVSQAGWPHVPDAAASG